MGIEEVFCVPHFRNHLPKREFVPPLGIRYALWKLDLLGTSPLVAAVSLNRCGLRPKVTAHLSYTPNPLPLPSREGDE